MNIDIKSIDELKSLLINHKNQQGMISELRAKNTVLQKDKQALILENERLRDEIRNLQCQLITSNNHRQDRLVLQRIINIGM